MVKLINTCLVVFALVVSHLFVSPFAPNIVVIVDVFALVVCHRLAQPFQSNTEQRIILAN